MLISKGLAFFINNGLHKLSTYPQVVHVNMWIMWITNLKYRLFTRFAVYNHVDVWITHTFVRLIVHIHPFWLSTTVDIL